MDAIYGIIHCVALYPWGFSQNFHTEALAARATTLSFRFWRFEWFQLLETKSQVNDDELTASQNQELKDAITVMPSDEKSTLHLSWRLGSGVWDRKSRRVAQRYVEETKIGWGGPTDVYGEYILQLSGEDAAERRSRDGRWNSKRRRNISVENLREEKERKIDLDARRVEKDSKVASYSFPLSTRYISGFAEQLYTRKTGEENPRSTRVWGETKW